MQRRFAMVIFVVFACLSFHRSARADTQDCTTTPGASDYVAQSGDVDEAQHISLARELTGIHKLQLFTCTGKLQIERSPDNRLHLNIASQAHLSHPMHAYIEHLQLSGDTLTLAFDFPKAKVVNVDSSKEHAVTITLQLPATIEESEIDQGAGTLFVGAGALKGNRKLNLGAGDAHLSLHGDHDYSSFEANIGIGSFHDNRPGGRSSHFVVSRSYAGNGTGHLEVNVGAGSVAIDPAREQSL